MINKNKYYLSFDNANDHINSFFETKLGVSVFSFLNELSISNHLLLKNSFINFIYNGSILNSIKCELLFNNEHDISIKDGLLKKYGYRQIPANKENGLNYYFLSNVNLRSSIHYLWVTTSKHSKQISNKNFSIMENSIRSIKNSYQEIKTYLWINDPSVLQDTISNAIKLQIEVKYFNQTSSWRELNKVIPHLISDFHYGVASDLMRSAILYDNGGIYIDLDYVVVNDFSWMCYNEFFISSGGTATSFMGGQKGSLFFSTVMSVMLDSIINLNNVLHFDEECYVLCDVAHNLGPYLLQIVYDNYPVLDVQVAVDINEKFLCEEFNQSINVQGYSYCDNQVHNELFSSMSELAYCVGYNYGHHYFSGITWCIV